MTSPQKIVITGASSGLGMALAWGYARPGCILGLIGRDRDRLEAVALQCREKGAETHIALLDVTDSDAIGTWLREFDHQHPIDLCIANAGISAGTGGGGESAEQARHIFNVNVNGVINTITPVLDRMKTRHKGQVAIVSSIAGFRGSPTAPAYSASKAAVRYLSQALNGEFAPHGVQVSVICPGFIQTPMTTVNRFPMPFIMTADKAATIIRKGLERKKNKIIFPLPMALLARLQNMIPDTLINRLYRSVPAKPSE